MRITLEKISSVTKNCNLSNEVTVTDDFKPVLGLVLAARVLNEKRLYNQLELPTGRFATVQKDDVIAVALGERRALKGYVGSMPKTLKTGDIIQLLNMGGVAGIMESENLKEVGPSFNLEILGAITGKSGKPLNIADNTLYSPKDSLISKVPMVIVSGTCMNSGKTTVASEVIKYATRAGLKVAAAKLSGVAAMRDTENMQDHGAKKATSFVDAGLPSTVGCETALAVAKGAIDYLAQDKPDLIVIEFGDGIYGEYGVAGVIEDPEISGQVLCHIGCAHDPVGALGLVEYGKRIKNPLHIISGPVTDNSVGINFIEKECGVVAINAYNNPAKIFTIINKLLKNAKN
ncbi:MAG: hypothetical protein WC304_02645 [Candidatus Gracilibacteria bacterium]|jgi:hypothetical protein